MPTDAESLRPPNPDDTRGDSDSVSAAHVQLIPGLTILYHPDLGRIGEHAPLSGLASGQEERLSRGEPAFHPPGSSLRPPFPLSSSCALSKPARSNRSEEAHLSAWTSV